MRNVIFRIIDSLKAQLGLLAAHRVYDTFDFDHHTIQAQHSCELSVLCILPGTRTRVPGARNQRRYVPGNICDLASESRADEGGWMHTIKPAAPRSACSKSLKTMRQSLFNHRKANNETSATKKKSFFFYIITQQHIWTYMNLEAYSVITLKGSCLSWLCFPGRTLALHSLYSGWHYLPNHPTTPEPLGYATRSICLLNYSRSC